MRSHSIYDVLPMNGQVLVFNSNLTLFDAINTLAEHNIFCAVMWDEINRKFVELFTIRDVVEILVFVTEQLELQYSTTAQGGGQPYPRRPGSSWGPRLPLYGEVITNHWLLPDADQPPTQISTQ